MLLALLLVTSISLITIDYRGGDDSPLDGVRSFAAAVFGPVERVAAAIASPVSDAVDGVGELGDGTRRGRPAGRARTRSCAASCAPASSTAAGPRSSTTCSSSPAPAATASCPPQVIAIGSAQTFSWTVTLDAGSRDGVRPDMTVLNGDGLVGRVKTVGPTTATVLLAIDPESSVGVRLEGSMEVGFTTGQGIGDGGDLDLQLLDGQSTRRAPATGWSPSARRATRRTCPGVPVGEVVSVQRHAGLADPHRGRSRRTSTSPRSTWSASSSSRRAPTRATPCCRRSPPATPTPTVTVTVTAATPTAGG